jgi:mannose-6-phosphate isomerase-like protein (cupin superfamily)
MDNAMPYAGQKFTNPVTGERVEMLETAAETAGQYVRFRTVLPSGKGFEVEHYHLIADETFEVESGTLSYKLDGVIGHIGAGERITLPRNRAHAHWNADAEELVMVQTIAPCHDTDRFLENLFGLAMDGKLDDKGTPPFLQIYGVEPRFEKQNLSGCDSERGAGRVGIFTGAGGKNAWLSRFLSGVRVVAACAKNRSRPEFFGATHLIYA